MNDLQERTFCHTCGAEVPPKDNPVTHISGGIAVQVDPEPGVLKVTTVGNTIYMRKRALLELIAFGEEKGVFV
jgi:hypothetical protein